VNKALYEMTADKEAARSLLFRERAESSYRTAASLDLQNPRVQMQFGMFLYQLGNGEEAEAVLLRAAELFVQSGAELEQSIVEALVALLDRRRSKIAPLMS
jgi:tetratricopeptide (TPR) repeat protein